MLQFIFFSKPPCDREMATLTVEKLLDAVQTESSLENSGKHEIKLYAIIKQYNFKRHVLRHVLRRENGVMCPCMDMPRHFDAILRRL